MKTLKQYIKESILDDEDDLIQNSEETIKNKLLDDLSQVIRSNKSRKAIPVNCKLKDGILSVENTIKLMPNSVVFNRDSENILNQLKELSDIHTLYSYNEDATNIVYFEREDPGKYFKNLMIQYLNLGLITKISNVNIKFLTKLFKGNILKVQSFGPVTLTNVNIDADMCMDGAGISFDELPIFKNVSVKGIRNIHIYDPCLFQDDDHKKLFDKFLDPTYTACFRKKNGDTVWRKGNTATLRASINQNKLYIPVDDSTPIFKINPKAKLFDILDVSKFDKKLQEIYIRDNAMEIIFSKDEIMRLKSCFKQKLPNDDWWMSVRKYN